MRRHLTLACEGSALAATLDLPVGPARGGLLIVSGGNEPRCGPHASMARLADRLRDAGIATLRFDRRGVGDSEGDNSGFEGSGPDMAAAAAALRAALPDGAPMAAFGNCDAAAALLLHGPDSFERLVLANPWTLEPDADGTAGTPPLPPPSAIRARYRARLRDPRALWSLMRGGVDLGRLARGLWALRPRASADGAAAREGSLASRMAAALRRIECPVIILIAEGDRTAQQFRASPAAHHVPPGALIARATPSHGFGGPGDADWLYARIVDAITR